MVARVLLVLLVGGVAPARATHAQEAAAPERDAGPAAAADGAGARNLTIDDVIELPEKLRPKWTRVRSWIDGTHWLGFDEAPPEPGTSAPAPGEKRPRAFLKLDAITGAKEPLFDPAAAAAAFAKLPGIDAARAAQLARDERAQFDASHKAFLVNTLGDLFAYRIDADQAARLTHDPGEEVGESFSPDGSMVAFVKDFDLHVAGVASGPTRALTDGGDAEHLIGRLDWVYQEEIYGRGNWQGYWWSPDSKRIAFLALDQTGVPEIVLTDDTARPDDGTSSWKVETWRYPKAGAPNPRARVGVVGVAGGEVTWIDLERYAGGEFLVARVGWTPDGREVVLQVQDRVQTWLDVVAADPDDGATRVLFREETGVWVEPTGAPFWLPDGERFLWLSERDGFRHLYLYARDGSLVRRLTEGDFEIDAVEGITPDGLAAIVSCDKDDVKGARPYRLVLDTAELEPLGRRAGTHAISLSPTAECFVDQFSSLADAGFVAVFNGDGTLVRTVAEADRSALAEFDLPQPRFVTLNTRDGVALDGMLVEPPGSDGLARHPVLVHVYGGPHAPQAVDRFLGRWGLWHLMLAQQGIAVFVVDNRSASGRGLAAARGIWKDLGAQELADVEDAVTWLVDEGIADPERVGIWGWSYGGYLSAYALTHSTRFSCGIAGAPVTDWRFYDSIYTERYMGLPRDNAEGYARSSVVEAAKDLHGRLFLIHGTIDENVHPQNTLMLVEALQKAGKTFDLMLYPGSRHSVGDRAQRRHLFQAMTEFVLDNL